MRRTYNRISCFVSAIVFCFTTNALSQTPPPVSFQAMVNYPVGPSPSSVAVGDFNGDGILDLAVANAGSGNVSVLLGNGDGTFQPAVNYAADADPVPIAVGDFNGDGNLDLAVADNGAHNVGILFGDGDGAA
jgi:hypothetical protein